MDKSKQQNKDKTKKVDGKIHPCTKAPSAEHSRGHDKDDPCDDARSGKEQSRFYNRVKK